MGARCLLCLMGKGEYCKLADTCFCLIGTLCQRHRMRLVTSISHHCNSVYASLEQWTSHLGLYTGLSEACFLMKYAAPLTPLWFLSCAIPQQLRRGSSVLIATGLEYSLRSIRQAYENELNTDTHNKRHFTDQ